MKRSATSGHHVVVIQPAFACLALLSSLKKIPGTTVTVFSAEMDDRVIPDGYERYIDQLICVDTNDYKAMADRLFRMSVTAVIPGSEYHVELAARLARYKQVTGLALDAAKAMRCKDFMREKLSNSAVRTVQFCVVTGREQLRSAFESVVSPTTRAVVMKPTQLAGSLGVYRVKSVREAQRIYDKIIDDAKSIAEMGVSSLDGIILEEYIDGKEYSVEGCVNGAGITIVSVTEKLKFDEVQFVEKGHIVQANLELEEYKQIELYVKQVLGVLGVNLGVFHLELRVDNNGPVIIEIAGRLPGDHLCELVQLARGVDLADVMVRAHMGLSLGNLAQPKNAGHAGIVYFSSAGKDQLDAVEGLENLQSLPGFVSAQSLLAPGAIIEHPDTFHGRVAYAVFQGDYETVSKSIGLAEEEVVQVYSSQSEHSSQSSQYSLSH